MTLHTLLASLWGDKLRIQLALSQPPNTCASMVVECLVVHELPHTTLQL